MPDVIDLISSTPPAADPGRAGAETSAQLSFTEVPSTQVPPSSPPSSFEDVFDLDNPAKKRRRVSDEYRKSAVFQFSDDLDGLPGGSRSRVDNMVERTVSRTVDNDNTIDSDPIIFTSSAPQTALQKGKAPASKEVRVQTQTQTQTRVQRDTITIDSDDYEPLRRDVARGPGPGPGPGPGIESSDLPDIDDLIAEQQPRSILSNRTASLLASLESPAAKKTAKRTTKTTDINEDPESQPQRKPRQTKQTSEAREAREAKTKARQREKQEEKDRKAQLKEQKAREKQIAADLAQVNKSKVDKKESTPEMIVDMHSSFEGTSVGNQAVEYMKRLGVEYTFFDGPMRGTVKWRRKVKAKFNDALGYWEPCEPHIKPENHVLCFLTAQEFVDLISSSDSDSDSDTNINTNTNTNTNTLEHHVQAIKRTHPDCKPIYLIEGLTAWMRKANNARNRAYQAEVRRQDGNPAAPAPAPTRRTPTSAATAAISDDTIEDALLHLQVTHASLIHHTSAAPETAEWLKTFTEHISTIPYRQQIMQGNDSAFCMDVGQVKTGDDRQDTVVKMLQEVNRVTASMAYGVVERYPTVGELVSGMERGGPSLLEDVKVSFFFPEFFPGVFQGSIRVSFWTTANAM